MSDKTAKVAISMPKEIFRSVEEVRRKLKLDRSEAVVEALQAWLKKIEEREMVRRYIEGYKKYPESRSEVKVWTRLAAQAFRKDPW